MSRPVTLCNLCATCTLPETTGLRSVGSGKLHPILSEIHLIEYQIHFLLEKGFPIPFYHVDVPPHQLLLAILCYGAPVPRSTGNSYQVHLTVPSEGGEKRVGLVGSLELLHSSSPPNEPFAGVFSPLVDVSVLDAMAKLSQTY